MQTQTRVKIQEDREILKNICENNGVDSDFLHSLIAIEENNQMYLRRPNIFENLKLHIDTHFKKVETLQNIASEKA